jgi:uncharacterized membrane protein
VSGLTRMTRTALDAARKTKPTGKDGLLSNPKKLGAAGVAVAALPVAVEQIAKRVAPKISDIGEQATDKLSDVRSGLGDAGDRVSSVGESAKQVAKGAAVSKLKPRSSERDGGGLLSKLKRGSSDQGDDDEQGRAAPGHGGSGRRMPIQQSVDVAVPIKVAYNRWTLFEDWPEFMHRFETVEQADDTTLSFSTKIWGITRRFEAEIVEQRPDQRIEWNVTEGPAHTGVVTFHKLADRLTRIEVSMDVEPHGLLEKTARGMRFTKRAVRADLHRFKALIELDEEAEGGWRGTIEGGKVKRRTERRSNSSGRRRRSQSKNGSAPSPARTGRSRSSS